jgi:tellurium resistance protein TerZ
VPPSKEVWAISGCQDHQTSADAWLEGQRCGALTWALLKGLKEHGWEFSYEELLMDMRRRLKGRFTQVPMMSTTRDGLFDRFYLGTHDQSDAPFAHVLPIDTPQPVELNEGCAVEVCDVTDAEKDVFTLGLSWDITAGCKIDLDAGCIMLDTARKPLDIINFQQLQSKVAGCVRHSGDNRSGAGSGDDELITVDLNRISSQMPSCQYIGFVINSYSGSTVVPVHRLRHQLVQAVSCHLFDTDRPTIDLARLSLSTMAELDCTAFLMCVLFRSGSKWFMSRMSMGASGRTISSNVDELQGWICAHLKAVKQVDAKQTKVRATVPKGTKPGQSLSVQLPSGVYVGVNVPEGAKEGTILEFTAPHGFVF